MVMFLGACIVAYIAEAHGSPAQHAAGLHTGVIHGSVGGNMEGKEQRFGIAGSALFNVVTTVTSCGAVNSGLESFTGIGGAIPMANLSASETIFGGVGTGLYSILLYVILAVFIGGLMVGRTPEYLGKKIESKDVKLASLAILILPASILGFTALSVLLSQGQAGPLNPGPHGFSEILYAFSSTTGNNGSAFAGLSGNTLYYNSTLGIAMWVGRFTFVIPILALAGKKVVPVSAGTLETDTRLFAGLLVGVVIIVGALTFFPALSLGPILEHLQLFAGKLAH
jgi:K+-transporting ATPase ATPase A chain